MKNISLLAVVVSIGFLGCNSDIDKSLDSTQIQKAWNRLFRTSKNETYTLVIEQHLDAGENLPPEVRSFKVHRKGKKFAMIRSGTGDEDRKFAVISNERYACSLNTSPTSGTWMVDSYGVAGSDGYNKLEDATTDYVQLAISADQILPFWNSISEVESDVIMDGDQAVLELAFEYPTSGREFLKRRGLRKDLAPKKGTVRFDIEKMQRNEPGWILSWDMTWSKLINGKEYIQHKRVEASDWKRFELLNREIPTVLNSFSNEPGEEIWYMRRKVVDIQPLTSEDAKLFYLSSFGLPELDGNRNWFWASILIGLFSAAALFFVFRRLRAR